MRQINGVLYLNDGDWVETGSALVEELDGSLAVIKWQLGAEPKVLHRHPDLHTDQGFDPRPDLQSSVG